MLHTLCCQSQDCQKSAQPTGTGSTIRGATRHRHSCRHHSCRHRSLQRSSGSYDFRRLGRCSTAGVASSRRPVPCMACSRCGLQGISRSLPQRTGCSINLITCRFRSACHSAMQPSIGPQHPGRQTGQYRWRHPPWRSWVLPAAYPLRSRTPARPGRCPSPRQTWPYRTAAA